MIRIKNPIAPRLPNEYQEVEYIESTGTQYIDTGVVNSISGVGCKIKFNFTDLSETQFLLGELTSSKSRFHPLFIDKNEQTSYFLYTNSLNYTILTYPNVTKDTEIHTLSFNANTTDIIFDGTKIGTASIINADTGGNIHLFSRNYSSSPQYAKARVYYCELYFANKLVREYIPCYRKSDNIAGLYDLMNNVFYTNAGTGVFLIGNEANKRDINIKPMPGNKPLIGRYAGDKLVYGKEPIEYEQLVNYTMLYDNGDECTDVTGGWSGTTYYTNSNFTKYDNYIHLHSYRATMYTNKIIDLSNYAGIGMFGGNAYIRAVNSGVVEFDCIYSSSNSVKQGKIRSIEGYLFYKRKKPSEDSIGAANNFYNEFSVANSKYLGVYFGDSAYESYINVHNVTLFKSDDWQTLANIAGITASSIDDILTNSDTLLLNKEAVDFMIYQCTGSFMASAVTNETFLTALNNSDYNTTIQANEHWNKFLSMVA